MMPELRLLRAFHVTIVFALWLGLLASGPVQPGRLSDASSSYLLLHENDAIDWHPWGNSALALAHRENKPIFLTIGYASCYWCHVLSRTTFEDERVVKDLNKHFVSILVDREERPDLDTHFMEIMLAMVGRSGYPAIFFLTPDLVPLFAAGYLAPDAKYGDPGFVEIAQSLATAWTEDRNDILQTAESVRKQLQQLAESVPGGASGGKDPRETATRSWSRAFDKTYGGFGSEPKFLHPNVLSFLLQRGV